MNCPICESQAVATFSTNFVNVEQCSNQKCRHLFAAGAPPKMGICELSPEKDYSEYDERNTKLVSAWIHDGFLKNGMNILDIGTGYGHILRTIARLLPDVSITSIEPSNSYFKRLKSEGFEVYKTLNEVPSNQEFDAVLFIEVIEHLDDPVQLLKEARTLMKKGAKIFVTTPAGDIRAGHPSPKNLDAYSNPTHVQFFTEKSMETCMSKCGFNYGSFTYYPELYPKNLAITGVQRIKLKWFRKYLHFRGQTSHLTYFYW